MDRQQSRKQPGKKSIDTIQNMLTRNKTQFKSLHMRKSPIFSHHHLSSSKLSPQSKNKTPIPIFLLYKDQKFVVKCNKMTSYGTLSTMLYQQIIKYEASRNQYKYNPKEEVSKIMENVLGFSTVCTNLKTDYLLSIGEGMVSKSLLLECFTKKKNIKRSLQTDKGKAQFKFCFDKSASNISMDESKKFKYELYNCLAIGGFSKVYLARSYEDGNFYTIKFIKKRKEQQNINEESVLNQMNIASELNHPFLIKMRESFETTNFYCMVFQYCPGGELFYLLKRIKIMPEDHARIYFLQILLGIKYIHENNIIYRDLKPENILIDRHGYLKIVDFGLSKRMTSNRQKTHSYCGSAQYMAPEMILRQGHNMSVDYYSLGALLYELVTGLPPFYSKNQLELQQSIVNQELGFPSHTPLSPELKDFLLHLLSKDQRQRLGSYAGIKQIIFHPWIGKFKPDEFLNKTTKLKIPYPPDLEQHNFDEGELGDDQQQFTEEVQRDFYEKSSSQLKSFFPTSQFATESIAQLKSNISQLINQFYEGLNKEVDRRLEWLYPREQKLKTYNHLNSGQKRGGQFEQLNSSEDKENKKQNKQIPKFINISKSICEERGSPMEINNANMNSYRKLQPYFIKGRVFKADKHHVPKANILKLRIMKNALRMKDNQGMSNILN